MNIIAAAINVFKVGKVVAKPEAWKKGQVHANQIVLLLTGVIYVAKAFGWDARMDDETIDFIAAGLFALVNWLFTVVSTDKVGITGRVPAKPAPADPAQDDVRGGP